MALSDTARCILAEAAKHPLRLVAPPDKLPVAAARAVLTNLLKQQYRGLWSAKRAAGQPQSSGGPTDGAGNRRKSTVLAQAGLVEECRARCSITDCN